jgi:signal transduction histidine kinase
MTDGDEGSRPQWRGPPWARGGRPPWWPEDEPFPPTGPPNWRGMRPRFARRLWIAFGLFFAALFATTSLAVFVVSGAFHSEKHHGLLPVATLLGLLLLIGFVWLGRSARRVAQPIGDVMQAADRVAAGDYTATVDARGLPEMRRLARSFNTMTERLRTDEERRRQLFADIAHELRTPLSVIQGNLEGMLDGLYAPDRARLETVLEETRVASRLLEDLRTLSTAEAGVLELHREPTSVGALVGDCVAALRVPADAKGVALRSEIADGLPTLSLDPVRIGEVLSNVVSNAVRVTPSGGSVTVSAERADGHNVSIRVTDTGPGIEPAIRDHLFERFVKGSGSGGAGLGLAIARTLVEAQGGSISADTGPDGTTISIVLPVA